MVQLKGMLLSGGLSAPQMPTSGEIRAAWLSDDHYAGVAGRLSYAERGKICGHRNRNVRRFYCLVGFWS